MLWDRKKTDLEPLEQRVTALETAVKLLQVEWNEVYDKIAAAQARDRKRSRDALRAADAPQDAPAPDSASKKAALWRSAAELLKGGHGVRR